MVRSFRCEAFTQSGLEVVVVNGKGNVDIDDYGITKFVDPGDEDDPSMFYMETYDNSQGLVHFVNETANSFRQYGQPIDWSNKRIKEWTSDTSGTTYGPDPIEGDRFLIMQNAIGEANDWKDVPLQEVGVLKDEHLELQDVPDSVCPGSTITFDIVVQGLCKAININGYTVNNSLTGETISGGGMDIDKSDNNINAQDFVKTVEVDIPSDAPIGSSIQLADISVNSSKGQASTSINLDIGSDPEELSLQSISDIEGVCSGDRVSPDIVAVNASNCSAELGVEIVNNYNSDVVTADSTSVPTGDAQPGTNSYFINFDVPDVSVDSVNYAVDLVQGDTVVDTETFSVDVSQPELGIGVFETPSQACSGDDIRMSVEGQNNGSCDGSGRVIINNNINDETITTSSTSLRADSSRSIRVEDTIPSSAREEGAITYTATLVDSDGIEIAEKSSSINIGSVSVSLQNFEFPNDVCAGKTVEGEVEVSNSGECPTDVTITITQKSTEETDILETVNLRDGSSRNIRFSQEIPIESVELDQDTFTLSTQVPGPDGNIVTDTLQTTANIATTGINLVGISSPSAVCVGSDINTTFNIANGGQCDGEFRVLVTDSISQIEQVVERSDIRAQRRDTAVLEDTMHIEAIQQDGIVYSYKIESLIADTFETVDTGQVTVNADTPDITVESIQSPDSACVGSSIEVNFNLANSANCDGEVRVSVTDSVSQTSQQVGQSEIVSDTSTTIRFNDSMPINAVQQGGVVYSYEVESLIGDTFETIDTGEVTVSAKTSELALDSVEIPSEQCIGSSVNFTLLFENVGQCDTEYRVVLNNVTKGDSEVVIQGNINAGNATTVRFDDKLTSELANEDVVTYDINLQKRVNDNVDWQTATDMQASVTILKPDVSVTSNTYPDFTSPGQKQYEIEVSNQSTCSTNIDVNISGETTNLDISPQSTLTVTDSFTVAADDITRDINITDNTLNSEVDAFQATVEPHKFINVNQSEGVLEIKGGFSEEAAYSGTILATAVSEGDNLEEESDSVVGALGANSIQGTSTTDSSDKDTVRFGTLKGMNIQISETASIVVDGEVRGTGKSYRHSTATSSLARFNDDEQPQIKTMSGPVSNLGAVRRRLNVGTTVLSGPIFTIDR